MLERWVLDPSDDARAFRFTTDGPPSPAQVAPAFERSVERGYVSFVQGEDLRDISLDRRGEQVLGTCAFCVRGLYEGALRLVALRNRGAWEITRVDLPALGLRSSLVDGQWRGSVALLGYGRVRRDLGHAFAPRVDRATFDAWKRPGARPAVDSLSDQSPGTALLTRSCVPRPGSTWRFLGGDGPPPLERFERAMGERAQRGFFTLIAPSDIKSIALSVGDQRVEEVDASSSAHEAGGTFTVRVDDLMEGEGRFEARYVRPDHLPAGLEGSWMLTAIELPGLGWRFELEEDLTTWRVTSLEDR